MSLRHLALSLQAWLIDADYDTELTGDAHNCFKLRVHYYGFGYSMLFMEVYISQKRSYGYLAQGPLRSSTLVNFELKTQWPWKHRFGSQPQWIGAKMSMPPVSIAVTKHDLSWTSPVTPKLPQDSLAAILSELERSKKAAKLMEVKNRPIGAQRAYSLREERRALEKGRRPPPKPYYIKQRY
jgi:hypothetical protein